MTKDELIQHRERARPIILNAWRKHNPGVRIKPLIGINPNYYVTSDGRVYCLHTIRDEQGGVTFKLESVMLYKKHSKGDFAGGCHNYFHVTITISSENVGSFPTLNMKVNRNRKAYKVSRLVARYFCNQESLDRTEVDHLDGNPANDNATNLEWVTPAENIRRRWAAYHARKLHPKL